MTYKTTSGAYKYEAVISVRVRFDMNSDSLYDARIGARRISTLIQDQLNENEFVNVPDISSATVDNLGQLPIDVTFCTSEVEATDHASRSVHSPSIWFEGAYMSATHLTNLWNSNLRILDNRKNEWSHVKMLDTGEHDNSDRIALPTVPQNMLSEHLRNEANGELTMKIRKMREDFVREATVKLLEGLYEDGIVPQETAQDDHSGLINNATRPTTYRDYVNAMLGVEATEASQPEPF